MHQKKSSRGKKILQNLPYLDLARSKYLIGVPLFSKFLREQFIPRVEEAKECFKRAMNFLKGENLILEFGFDYTRILYGVC